MEDEDRLCLGLFLLKINRHRNIFFKESNTSQDIINGSSWLSLTPFLLPKLQVNQSLHEASTTTFESETMGQAITSPFRPQLHYPCYWQINAIIVQQQSCFPSFGDHIFWFVDFQGGSTYLMFCFLRSHNISLLKSGSIYALDILKTKITTYLTWESYMYQ